MTESYPEDLQAVYEHEDTLTNLDSEIEQTLDDNVIQHDNPTRNVVISALEYVLSIDMDTEEANQLANNLASVIVSYDSESTKILQEMGADDQLVRMLTMIASKYQSELYDVILKTSQGDRFWRAISTEYTMNERKLSAGLRHELENGRGEEFTLTTSVESNIRLISLLLGRQIRAMDVFEEELIDPDTYTHIKTLEEQVEQLKEIEEARSK